MNAKYYYFFKTVRIEGRPRLRPLPGQLLDGAPNESPELVKKSVQNISKDGFKVVAVSIDPYYDPATMYENNVVCTDLPSLAICLGKMVKTALMKKLSR